MESHTRATAADRHAAASDTIETVANTSAIHIDSRATMFDSRGSSADCRAIDIDQPGPAINGGAIIADGYATPSTAAQRRLMVAQSART